MRGGMVRAGLAEDPDPRALAVEVDAQGAPVSRALKIPVEGAVIRSAPDRLSVPRGA